MYKILLTGHGCSHNRGSEAIVRSTFNIIKRYLKETKITLLSWNPLADRSELWPELWNLDIPDVWPFFPNKYSVGWVINGLERRLIKRLIPGYPSFYSLKNRALYKKADIIISIGGDNFWGGYGSQSHFFGELALARSLGKITVIWGASINDFKKKLEYKWARRLRQVDLITVRDRLSLDYLASLGIIDNVRLVADPAFLLPAQKEGVDLFKGKGSGVIVGIGLSAMVTRFGIEQSKYLEAFLEFIKHLLELPEYRIVLIPHVLYESQADNDYWACNYIASKLNEKERVMVVGEKYNACQLKYIISQCDYFIGSRMHSAIASLSSMVPTLSIAYSPKYLGLNRDIFGHMDHVIPVQELNGKMLKEKFLALIKHKNEIIQLLSKRIPELIILAEKGGEYLAETLQKWPQ